MTGENHPPLIIISGPTAMGKTNLSLSITDWLNNSNISAEIVNFDSLLFYRELNIGTAKPDREERSRPPHHLIDVASAKNPINAFEFVEKAIPTIEDLRAQGKIPVLVGGSAFYLRALMKEMYQSPEASEVSKRETQEFIQQQGIQALREFLRLNDPQSFEELHANDHYRITRAYEHFKATGRPLSEEKKRLEELEPYNLAKNTRHGWIFFHMHLDMPKDEHYPIIEQRAAKMVESGLTKEVQELLQRGFSGKEKPLQSVGYKETLNFLQAEWKDQQELIQQIFIATRQLAKAQRTFFRKIGPKETFHPLREQDRIFTWLTSELKKIGLL